MFSKISSLAYGCLCYGIGMASLVYIGLWLVNLYVPNAIDAPVVGPTAIAVVVNLALVLLFGLQHSGMARPAFKARFTRLVPVHLERSTYVLISGIATVALCYFWHPVGGVVWEVTDTVMLSAVYILFGLGWALLVISTFWINHFDLFGLRQVWLFARGETYTHIPFKTPGFYQHIRHPLYVGWFTVIWAAPVMTITHLMFALATTAYILLAIRWEEADLEKVLPEYGEYKARTPMLVPGIGVSDVQAPRGDIV